MSVTRLSLADYQELMAELSPPDEEQRLEFARYVANAHSWYKHLPGLLPGAPFFFFFDPVAGLDRYHPGPGDGLAFRDKPRGAHFFHYNEMPTYDYRRRFGWLSYSCDRGTQIFYRTLGGVADNNLMRPVIHMRDGQAYELPVEVVEVGAIELTGTISDYMATHWLIRSIHRADSDRFPGQFFDDPDLPIEWLRFDARCEEKGKAGTAKTYRQLEQRMEKFIVRDRARQLQAMYETISAATELAFGAPE